MALPPTRCFDRFFRVVNINERRLLTYRGGFVTERVDLLGIDYLWKAVQVAPDSIVYKPIELLKDVYTNLNSKLQKDQVHAQFIQTCMSRLHLSHMSLQQYKPGEIEKESPEIQQGHKTEVSTCCCHFSCCCCCAAAVVVVAPAVVVSGINFATVAVSHNRITGIRAISLAWRW